MKEYALEIERRGEMVKEGKINVKKKNDSEKKQKIILRGEKWKKRGKIKKCKSEERKKGSKEVINGREKR